MNSKLEVLLGTVFLLSQICNGADVYQRSQFLESSKHFLQIAFGFNLNLDSVPSAQREIKGIDYQLPLNGSVLDMVRAVSSASCTGLSGWHCEDCNSYKVSV